MSRWKSMGSSLGISAAVLSVFTVGLALKDGARFSDASHVNPVVRFLNTLEFAWYDFKFRRRAPQLSSDVFVAKIDDASLERFGNWPWPRAVYSEILGYLHDLGADVVAFDAVFAAPEYQERYLKESLTTKVESRPASLQQETGLSDDHVSLLSSVLPSIGTQIFASSVRRYPKTVLGYVWQFGRDCPPLFNPDNPEDVAWAERGGQDIERLKTREGAASAGVLHVETLVDSVAQLNAQSLTVPNVEPINSKSATSAHIFQCPIVNRSELNAWAKHQGFFNAVSDSDGLFRRSLLVAAFEASFVPDGHRDFLEPLWYKQATFFPSLALKAVAAYWDSPGIDVKLAKRGDRLDIESVSIRRQEGEPIRIDTLADGTVPINFYGTQAAKDQPIPEFSLARIGTDLKDPALASRVNPDPEKPLKGKIVLIGPTALGVYDLRPNPVQGDGAGVFLHAAMAARILEHARHPESAYGVNFVDIKTSVAVLWAIGLALGALLGAARALQGALAISVVVGAYLAFDVWVFGASSLALDAMTSSFAFAAIFLTVFAYKYFTEEKDRAFVKGAFEKYVSPDVVSSILQDPKKLNLGGQRKELSVLFSDVRGFTTISEKMTAVELAKFMNDYLSPMTDVVLENRGTIDKYMGDAIMAIFGAPINYDEHAQKAVDAALGMMAKLEELKVGWIAAGVPPVDIGIGINTGEMSVGNMGSTRIFSYTVMGDSVNLGSRLEGINKEYGTHIIVSEFTRARLPSEYVVRELDRVKVKGKKLPVTIFEVMGKGELPERRLLAQKFEAALQLYYAENFVEAQALFQGLADQDPTSAIYVERCEQWRAEPPESGWDGSWTMKTK